MSHLHPFPPSAAAIHEAVAALQAGKLLLVATETVFGVVADAGNAQAVDALYAAKGRGAHVPLQILLPTAAHAATIGAMNAQAEALAQRFWPGALTLVLPLRADAAHPIAPNVLAGGTTIGIRVPNHPVPQALLAAFGKPLAASSANRSGEPAAHTAQEAMDALGAHAACVLDGPCDPTAAASSVIDTRPYPPAVLREGGISTAAILDAVRDAL